MHQFLYFGLIVLVIICVYLLFRLQRRTFFSSRKLTAPPWVDEETKQLFQQFNHAWSNRIEQTINRRLKKVSQLSDGQLRERWYELKKYLFLAGISKGLPMFSERIDEVWHFFLEDTQLYNEFCFDFIGERIEHHPHDKPIHLPYERAWFDLLYLSFFNINAGSHLWGDFMQEKEEHAKWIDRIINEPEGIIESFGRSDHTASVYALASFLQFANEQLSETDEKNGRRVKMADGYWYGTALFSIYSYDVIQEEKKKMIGDGSAGFIANPDQNEDWNEMVADVNTFDFGTAAGAVHGGPSDSGGTDSGSSCSSCSGCSS